MKRLRLIVILLHVTILVSGCWNSREIEHLLYLNALGVDYEDNQVVVYAQILSFTNIAKQEAGGQRQQETVAIVKGSGDTYANALFGLYPTSQQRLAWSHIRTILFSERALKHNIVKQVLDEMDRYYEFRYTLWTFATREPLLDVLNAKPIFHISVLYSQLTDPEEIYKQNSTIEPIKLYRFISQKDEPDGVVFLPTLSTNKNHWSENGKYKPKLEINGVCILQNEQFKAYVPRDELLGLRWLTRHTKRTVLGVEKNKKNLAIIVVEKPNAVIRPIMKNGKTAFRVEVFANGFITQYLQSGPIEVVEKEAAKKIEAEIRSLFEKGLEKQTDTLQLGHILYRRNPQEWQRQAVNNSLPLTPSLLDSIHVEVKLKNGGISKVKQ